MCSSRTGLVEHVLVEICGLKPGYGQEIGGGMVNLFAFLHYIIIMIPTAIRFLTEICL